MDFRILGPLEVLREGRSVALPRGRGSALLAILILRIGEVVSTDRLIIDLWGETPPRTAVTGLHGLVSNLRNRLEPSRATGVPPTVLVTRPPGYVLAIDPDQVDANRFRRLVSESGDAPDPETRATKLHEALTLWRGPALANFAYELFAQAAIAELEELRLAAIEERIDADLTLGRHGELVGELESLVSEHPLRERLRRHLMVALYRSGRQVEALQVYRDARQTLVEELGIDPGPDLQLLEQAILRQDHSLDQEPQTTKVSRGRTVGAPGHNLPEPLTRFVGREREIEQVKALLSRARLVTLTGPGGCGKTRLALRIASMLLAHFRDGVFLVSLADLRDASLIVPSIARTLGLKERPDEPVGETLTRYLARREMLLLLDNFEHLVDGAPAVTRLLEAAPGVKALITSREGLRLSGEHDFAVPPLQLPDLASMRSPHLLAKLDAVALFIQRAEVADPRFRMTEENAPTVAEICLRLDGLPLSIELAASMLRTFDPEVLLARLGDALSLLTEGPRDVPSRQRTLRNTMAWSYDLLSGAEQALFRRLGIFLRGCTIEAARGVVNPDDAPGIDLRPGMLSLVSKSLLLRDPTGGGEPRFRMLETIREYARAQLLAKGELRQLAARHSELFLGTAEEAEPHLLGSEQAAWLDRIEQDHDNLRAALQWAIETGDAETGMRLGGALWRFWLLRGHLREGRGWLERVLALPAAQTPSPHRVKALTAVGGLAYWQAEYAAAGDAYRETLEICKGLGDVAGEAAALYNLGYIVLIEDDLEEAWTLFTAAREIHRRLGDRSAYAYDGLGLGLVAVHRGEYGTALQIHEEALALFRNLGDRFGLGSTLIAVGRPYREKGDFDRVEELNREAVAIFREAGDLAGIAMALGATAALRVVEGQVETGLRLGGAAHAIEEEIGGGAPVRVRTYEDARDLALGTFEPDAIERAWAAGGSLSIDQAVALMLEEQVAESPHS